MKNPSNYPTVLDHFPNLYERIVELLQSDPDFEEMCSDYEQLANWLVVHGQDGCTPESECAANRLLLAELEIEILQILQAIDRQSGHQA